MYLTKPYLFFQTFHHNPPPHPINRCLVNCGNIYFSVCLKKVCTLLSKYISDYAGSLSKKKKILQTDLLDQLFIQHDKLGKHLNFQISSCAGVTRLFIDVRIIVLIVLFIINIIISNCPWCP